MRSASRGRMLVPSSVRHWRKHDDAASIRGDQLHRAGDRPPWVPAQAGARTLSERLRGCRESVRASTARGRRWRTSTAGCIWRGRDRLVSRAQGSASGGTVPRGELDRSAAGPRRAHGRRGVVDGVQRPTVLAWLAAGGTQGIWWNSFDGANWIAQQRVTGVGTSVGPSLTAFDGRLYMAWRGVDTGQGI